LLSFSFSFFFEYNRRKRKTYGTRNEKKESVPKQGGTVPENKKLKEMGMQLEENLVAAQQVTWWAQKFTLRLMELANQLVVDGDGGKEIWNDR
jgi:hypothetical protein